MEHPTPTLLDRLPGVVWFFVGMLLAGAIVALLLVLAHAEPPAEHTTATPARAPQVTVAMVRCPPRISRPSLVDAAACGDRETLHARLAAGADVDQTDARPEMHGRTALHHAVQRGDEALVATLLTAGANPDTPDAQGNTPLHLLALNAEAEHPAYVARALLAAKARFDLRNINGRTALGELEAAPTRLLEQQDLVQVLVRAAHIDDAPAPKVPLAALAEAAVEPPLAPPPPPAASPTPPAPEAAPEAMAAPVLPDAPAQAVAPAQSDAPALPDTPAQAVATTTPPAPDPRDAIRARVHAWADAWSRKDMPAYLAHYDTAFTPEDGLAPAAWTQQRTRRIAGKRGAIAVALRDLTVTYAGRTAQVRFEQHYRSANYREVSRKQLDLVLRDGQWCIVRELNAG
ncbi:MAG: ankyrin repeat domain-containing protein [Rhodocyclaceae bacterium]|nr:ankyrin repeat domain-containing protein [Rhodocyclaceae bacterium]